MKKLTKRFLALMLVLAVTFAGIIISSPDQVSAAASGKKIVVSIGDSYSSGEGIEPFFGQDKASAEKVEDEDWLAHRSEKVWSSMLEIDGQKMVHDDNWFFAAASGAETTDLYNQQMKSYNYDGLTGSKGLTPQLEIFDKVEEKYGKNAVDYVTVSIGGNDIGFTDMMTTAIMQTNTLESTLEQLWQNFSKSHKVNGKKVASTRDLIKKAYQDIADKAGKQAKIIVVGYPRLLSDESFTVNAGFFNIEVSSETTAIINASCEKLDKELAALVEECKAEGLNIYYVSVIDAFKGHEAYTEDAYINSVNAMAAAQDLDSRSMVSAYSMHPNEKGAKAYAKAVQSAIDSINGSSSASNKPVVTLTAKKGKITIKWTKVAGAKKYRVVEYVNGKAKTVKKTTTKTSYTVKNREKGTEYTFAVKAYVKGKWTTIKAEDQVSIIAK